MGGRWVGRTSARTDRRTDRPDSGWMDGRKRTDERTDSLRGGRKDGQRVLHSRGRERYINIAFFAPSTRSRGGWAAPAGPPSRRPAGRSAFTGLARCSRLAAGPPDLSTGPARQSAGDRRATGGSPAGDPAGGHYRSDGDSTVFSNKHLRRRLPGVTA